MIVNELVTSPDPITIRLIGCGGNGSNLLANLGMIHAALVQLGKPGLDVMVYDADDVSEHNIGRQKFSFSDINQPKASTLVNRINRYYNTTWRAVNQNLGVMHCDLRSNIIITCVDNVKTRKFIKTFFDTMDRNHQNIQYCPFWWVDLGNGRDSGNILIKDLKNWDKKDTKHIFDYQPDIKEKKNVPSCSMLEALNKQSLFVNIYMATTAAVLIYDLCTKKEIDKIGAFVDIDKLKTNIIYAR